MILTSLKIAVDSGFDACPSAGLGLGTILRRVRLAGISIRYKTLLIKY